jgi:hypothetical protein
MGVIYIYLLARLATCPVRSLASIGACSEDRDKIPYLLSQVVSGVLTVEADHSQ